MSLACSPAFVGWRLIIVNIIYMDWTCAKSRSDSASRSVSTFSCNSVWLDLLTIKTNVFSPESENLYKIAERFGTHAIFYICLLLISGLIFAYILIGDLSLLLSTVYGNVFLMKITLVSALLGLGAVNKFRLVPLMKLLEPSIGAHRLRKSIQIEMLIALLSCRLAVFLTTSTTLPMGG